MGRKIYDEDLRLNLILNGQGLASGSSRMVAELGKLEMKMIELENEAKKVAANIKILEKNATANATALSDARNKYTLLTQAIRAQASAIEAMRQKVGLAGMTVQQLRNHLKSLQVQLFNMPGNAGTATFQNLQREIRETQIRLNTLTTGASRFSQAWGRMEQTLNRASAAIGFAMIAVYAIVRVITNVITRMKTLEDLLGTVRKNTQLTTDEVWNMKEAFDSMSTRTASDDLLKLAVVAGKLGINGKEDIMKFVEAGNMIQVALGDDLDGTVEDTVNSIGKLTNAFRVFNDLNEKTGKNYTLDEAMLATGSVLNELAKSSAASAGTILNYMTRLSGVSELAGFTIPQIGALGSVLDAANVPAERGATAMQKIMLALANPKKINDFAEALGMTADEYRELLLNDPNTALTALLTKFISTKKGLVELTGGLKDFGAKGQYMTAVLGTLAQNLDVYQQQTKIATDAYKAQTSVLNEYDIMNNNFTANILKQQKIIRAQTDYLNRESEPTVLRLVTVWASFVVAMRDTVDWIGRHWTMIKLLTFAYIAYKVPAMWRISNLILDWTWTQKNLIVTRAKIFAMMTEIAFTKTLTVSQQNLLATSKLATIINIAYTQGIGKAITALKAMALAQYSIPFVAVGVVVIALVAAFYKLVLAKDAVSEADARLIARQKDVRDTFVKEKASLDVNIEQLKDVNISQTLRTQIIRDLKEAYSDYLPFMKEENVSAADMVKNYTLIVDAMQKKAIWEKAVAAGNENRAANSLIDDEIKKNEELLNKYKERAKLGSYTGMNMDTDETMINVYEKKIIKLHNKRIALANEWVKIQSDIGATSAKKPVLKTQDINDLMDELDILENRFFSGDGVTTDIYNAEKLRLSNAIESARILQNAGVEMDEETFKQKIAGLKEEMDAEIAIKKDNAIKTGKIGEALEAELAKTKLKFLEKEIELRKSSGRDDEEGTLQKLEDEKRDILIEAMEQRQKDASEGKKKEKTNEKDNIKDVKEFTKELIDIEKLRIATITNEREKAIAEENLRFEQEIADNWKNDTAIEYAEQIHQQNLNDISLEYWDKKLADSTLNQKQKEILLEDAHKSEQISDEQYWTFKAQFAKEKEEQLLEFKKQYALLSSNELAELEISELKKTENYALLSEENKQKAIDGIILKYGRKRASNLKRTLDTELNTIKEGWNEERLTAFEEGEKQISIFKNIGDKVTGIFEGMFAENQNAMAVFGKEMLMIALDFVKAEIRLQYPLILAKQIAKKGPIAGPISAGTSIALIEAAMAVGFGVAKSLVSKIETTKKVTQNADGNYPVIGADDGRLYNAVNGGRVKTGVYSQPTLLGMNSGLGLVAERGPELVVDSNTFRRIQIDSPRLLQEIYQYAGRGQVVKGAMRQSQPQYAGGSYPTVTRVDQQSVNNNSSLVAAINKLNAHLDKGIAAKAYINKYGHNGIEEAITEITKFNKLTR